LSKRVRDQDDVDQVALDHVVETLRQSVSVAGHSREPDLSLLLGAPDELVPLRILHPRDAVHRVVQVDVDMIRAQTPKARFQSRHLGRGRFAGLRLVLGGDRDLRAASLQRLPETLFGSAVLVPLGGVEVSDAAIERVVDELRLLRQLLAAEGDVRNAQSGLSECDVPPDVRRLGADRRSGTLQREQPEREGDGGASAHELPAIDSSPQQRRLVGIALAREGMTTARVLGVAAIPFRHRPPRESSPTKRSPAMGGGSSGLWCKPPSRRQRTAMNSQPVASLHFSPGRPEAGEADGVRVALREPEPVIEVIVSSARSFGRVQATCSLPRAVRRRSSRNRDNAGKCPRS
jgi:hypothetical protein